MVQLFNWPSLVWQNNHFPCKNCILHICILLGIVYVTVQMIYFQVYKVNIGDLANAKWPAAKKAKKSFLVFAHFSKKYTKKNWEIQINRINRQEKSFRSKM